MRAALVNLSAVLGISVCVVFTQGLPVISQSTLADPKTQTQLAAMEEKFFEHDFSKESVDYRLARLEKFAFGQTTPGNADARIEKLSSVINLHANLVPSKPVATVPTPVAASAAPAADDESYVDDDESDTPAKYPHITALEQEILKQTFESDSVANRLSRMEKTAFGAANTKNPDAASRTDALDQYAETKLHQKPYGASPYNTGSRQAVALGQSPDSTQQSTPARKHSLIADSAALLANSVLSMASPMPFSPMMMPGTGGFQQSDDPDADAVPRPEDPAVFQESPPDAHARMLVRVGWCEQHLLGHTYPNLHLQQRLHQLNAELYPNDHEPDIKLMDRVDVIVKAVVMKQHPPLAWAGGH